MPLDKQRRALRLLLDENNPADAMASYYAFYHDEDRTQIISDPEITAETPSDVRAKGYVAISRTGIDLFRPLLTTRLPIDDLDFSARLLQRALPSGNEAFLVCPIQYAPLIQAIFDIRSEQKLLLYTFQHGMPDPIVNIFVNRDDQSDTPRFVINRSINGQRVTVSSAGVNWITPNFAEIAVRTWSEYRRRGMGKSVVSALTRHLIESGRRPLYAVNETNYPSIELANQLGFRDSGYRQLMLEVQAR